MNIEFSQDNLLYYLTNLFSSVVVVVVGRGMCSLIYRHPLLINETRQGLPVISDVFKSCPNLW